MPRRPEPIPPIAAVPRDLGVEEVQTIIELAERAQARRVELAAQMRAALASGDQARVVELARGMCGMEEELERQ